MRSTLPWIVFVIIVFAVACKNEDPPVTNNNNNNGGDTIELCDTLDATYNGNVSAILNTHCAVSGCHAGPAPSAAINLSNYENAKFAAAKPVFLGAVNHENGFVPMPYQKDQLEQPLLDILNCWVANGFPEN